MPEISFNVVAEPWIPCLMRSGHTEELSLREALGHAPEIQEVVDASPLVTAALHRLLIAILHRCFGPKSDDEWSKLWRRGSFDMTIADDYLGKWEHRFQLFDRDRPFFQTPGLSHEAASSVAKLAHELSAGHNSLLFDHSLDDAPSPVAPAVAARYLVALHAFAVGGLVSFQKGEEKHRSANAALLTKGAVLILTGRNLFETLLLNMVNVDGEASAPFEFNPKDDAPAWEQGQVVVPEDRLPWGYLDLLTWQSRRVLLEAGAQGVSRIVLMKGYQLPSSADIHTRETMIAFLRREKAASGQDPWPPLGFRAERALWRDSLALLKKVPDQRLPPRTFEELANRDLDLGQPVGIAALGMSSDRAKVFLWRHERLPLPLQYLSDPALVGELGRAISASEEAGNELRKATWLLAQEILFPEGQPDKVRLRAFIDSLSTEGPYWSALDSPFRTLMVELAGAWPDQDQEKPLRAWATAIGLAASNAFEAAARSLETSGRGYRAAAEARGWFARRLHLTLDELVPQTRKESLA